MYWVDNGLLRLGVSPQGAEWRSLQSHGSGQQWLWSGDPNYWSGVAPLLFPIIGALRNDQYRYQGQSYTMPRHGFFRHSTPDLMRHSRDELRFRLQDSPATRLSYPFAFRLGVRFALEDNSIVTTLTLHNPGTVPMPFALGAHPAFRVPLGQAESESEEESYEDYALHFANDREISVYALEDGLLGRTARTIELPDGVLALDQNMFNNDALILKSLRSRELRLAGINSNASIRLSYEGFSQLGIWAAPGADFLCIEPWLGHADTVDDSGDIMEKEGIHFLAPDETKRLRMQVYFDE